MALPVRYFSGKYAGKGGSGDEDGKRIVVACDRMDDNDGRGARNEAVDDFGVYMPRPTAFSGRAGRSAVVESLKEGTSVYDDNEVEDRHLNDISENIGRCKEAL